MALTLKRARFKPAKGAASTTTTRLKVILPDPGIAALDPTKQDTVLQLHRPGALDYCARVPAASVLGKKGKSFKFRDKTGAVSSAAGVDTVIVKRKKNGILLASVSGKAARR